MKSILNFFAIIFRVRKRKEVTPLPKNKQDDLPLSDPYILLIKNETTEDKLIELFGSFLNKSKQNMGLPDGIKVINLQVGDSEHGYAQLVEQIESNPCIIGKWRFQSATRSQLTQRIFFWDRDANGEEHKYPCNLAIMPDAYQQQQDVIDVCKSVPLDGEMTVQLPILAMATLVIAMFPVEINYSRVRKHYRPLIQYVEDDTEI